MRHAFAAALGLALLFSSGCCTQRNTETAVSVDSYVEVLQKVKSNLVGKDGKGGIRATLDEALGNPEAGSPDAAVKDSSLNLVDDTVDLIDGTLEGKNAGAADNAGDGSSTDGSESDSAEDGDQ
jgi:hypothetical protein